MPDLSKVGEKLKSRGGGLLKDLKGSLKDTMKLPKLQSKSKLPLEYNLSTFVEIYAGPRHGTEPTAHPKHDRTHADFDPFEIPMPTLKAEWSPKDAFAKVGASDLLRQPIQAARPLQPERSDGRFARRWMRTAMAS